MIPVVVVVMMIRVTQAEHVSVKQINNKKSPHRLMVRVLTTKQEIAVSNPGTSTLTFLSLFCKWITSGKGSTQPRRDKWVVTIHKWWISR